MKDINIFIWNQGYPKLHKYSILPFSFSDISENWE